MADRIVTAPRHDSGFTVIEVLVALFLMGLGLMAICPMFVFASRVAAESADMGTAGALAVQRMEVLRTATFKSLAAGGDLNANAAGYFDASDPRAVVRWTVADNVTPATAKTIVVCATGNRQAEGPGELVTLTSVRTP